MASLRTPVGDVRPGPDVPDPPPIEAPFKVSVFGFVAPAGSTIAPLTCVTLNAPHCSERLHEGEEGVPVAVSCTSTGSHASPSPSPSASLWLVFAIVGQLSQRSPTLSPSASACCGLCTFGQLSSTSSRPSWSESFRKNRQTAPLSGYASGADTARSGISSPSRSPGAAIAPPKPLLAAPGAITDPT